MQIIPWYLHTIIKSGALKTWESHFSLVWVLELSIITTCFRKGKVFPENFKLANLVGV